MTPFHVEPLRGRVSIKAGPGLKLYTGKQQQLPVSYEDGRYVITFDGLHMSNWLFLK